MTNLYDHAMKAIEGTGLKIADLCSTSRSYDICRARERFVWSAHNAGYSFPMIGRYISKHHSAMVYAFQRHDRRVAVGKK